MTLQEMLQEEREEGREEGRKEERKLLLFQLATEGMISLEQGAGKLGISVDEFRERMAEYSDTES